jgi:DNA-binding phage protein
MANVEPTVGRHGDTKRYGNMVLTRDSKETVKERAARDATFAKAMLGEAATVFLNGEPRVARAILRDLINASIGFEALAAEANCPSKSLRGMLSEKGNPSMDNLAAIFGVMRKRLDVAFEAQAVEAA